MRLRMTWPTASQRRLTGSETGSGLPANDPKNGAKPRLKTEDDP
jgi:hypothetical protein